MVANPTAVHPQPAARASLRPSGDFSCWAHYSTAKLLALDNYTSRTDRWRVLAVLVLTPLPALLCSVLPSLVPLANPLDGFTANRNMLINVAIANFLVSLGTILLTIGAVSITRHQYSESAAVASAAVTTAMYVPITYLFFSYWRFPVPFAVLLMTPIWGLLIAVAHIVVFNDKLKNNSELHQSLRQYEKPSAFQLAQLVVYTGMTVVFERVSTGLQVLMIVLFPLVKFALKRWLRRYVTAFNERSIEITVSTIEICASLYQSMIMQSAPSPLALCAIMRIDVAQGFVTPTREVFPRALGILRRAKEHEQMDVHSLATLHAKLTPAEFLVVQEALELASAAEKILLVEYFEVSVPVVNALFLLLSCQPTSTLYNTRLNRFYNNSPQVLLATKSVLLYSLLQGLSLVVFHAVLRWRHRTSALHHLTFVLEHHARAIQGKLLVFFTLIFYFTLLHNGADFRLRFDYKASRRR